MRILLAALVTASWAAAQAVPGPDFDVVSVKIAQPVPVTSTGALGIRVSASGGPGTSDPGRINYLGMTLLTLVMRSYSVKAYQTSGPPWMSQDRFDVAAKLPPGATKEQLPLMLQKLLADRFQVVVHHETREVPMYALVIAKNGPKLQESKKGDAPPPDLKAADGGSVLMSPPGTWIGNGRIGGKKATMADLAGLLAVQLNRPVKDMTGLNGAYDFTVEFTPDETLAPDVLMAAASPRAETAGGLTSPDASVGPSLLVAVQNQLGLRLDARKGPIDFIVIDRAQKVPTGN